MNEFGAPRDASHPGDMWAAGGGSWHQWPLQPSMFQNIPHEQIDWAALAQQWIQMRESVGGGPSPSQLTPGSGSSQFPSRPPNDVHKRPLHVKSSEGIDSMDESSNSQEGNTFRQGGSGGGGGDWAYWNSGNWNSPHWNVPPHAVQTKDTPVTYEFGQGSHNEQGFPAQTYDYNHGSDQYGYNQAFVEQNQFGHYWPPGQPSSVSFVRKDRRLPPPDRDGTTPPTNRDDDEMMALPPPLDAAKRKQLPAWIREGLEKVEREKQKKLEKERLEKEREVQLRSMEEAEKRAIKEMQDSDEDVEDDGDKSTIPQKSKFESDSDDDRSSVKSPARKRISSPEDDDIKSEEDRMANLMMRVRQLLTELLLEVTNEELVQIAKEVYQRAKAKAPAMQLATSSALASLTRGLGVGEYGSDDSDDSAEGSDQEAEDSDIDLQASIRQRLKEFAEKEKEIVANLKDDDSEGDSADGEGKATLMSNFLQPSPEREKYHFEKKYNEIPGLDVMPDTEDNSVNVSGKGENEDKKPSDIDSDMKIGEKIDYPGRKSTGGGGFGTDVTTEKSSTTPDSDSSRSTSPSSRARDSSSRHGKPDNRARRDRSKSRERSRERRDRRKRRSRSRSSSRSRSRRRRSRSQSSCSRGSHRRRSRRSQSREWRRSRTGYNGGNRFMGRGVGDRFRKGERERNFSPSSRSISPSSSSNRRPRKDRSRRDSSRSNSRSRSRSRSPNNKKFSSSSNDKREKDARASRSPSIEKAGGSGKKSSRKN